MKTITLVGIAIVTVLVGAPAIRTVTAQGKGRRSSQTGAHEVRRRHTGVREAEASKRLSVS